jgi:hypothetical protein
MASVPQSLAIRMPGSAGAGPALTVERAPTRSFVSPVRAAKLAGVSLRGSVEAMSGMVPKSSRPATEADLLALPDEGRAYELIDGRSSEVPARR